MAWMVVLLIRFREGIAGLGWQQVFLWLEAGPRVGEEFLLDLIGRGAKPLRITHLGVETN